MLLPVFDILNCGPRNRFSANGKLVHNSFGLNQENLPRVERDKDGTPTGTPMNALRLSLCAPKGHKVVVSDLSGIELRVNHFLWQAPSSMELFRKDPAKADLYKDFASKLFNVPVAEVTKAQRQIGKLCIAEGTLVLTDRGEIPIEEVTANDKVWDGVEWVSTLGAVYKGEKEVIEYDGLIATPDHEVWVKDGRKVPFWYAATQSLRLARTGVAGVPLGYGGVDIDRGSQDQRSSVCASSMHRLWNGEISSLQQLEIRQDERVPVVQSEMWGTGMVASKTGGCTPAMHEPKRHIVQQIWSEGNTVSVSECGGCGSLGNEQSGAAQGEGTRQNRQQRPLRTRKSAMGNSQAECCEPAALEVETVSLVQDDVSGCSLRGQHAQEPAAQGPHVRSDSGAVEPPIRQTKRRVWDLLNCGSRHRFTANGRLVSNCHLGLGYSAGAKTFVRIAKLMGGVSLSLDEATDIVARWRTEYAEIVRGWKKCQQALSAISQGCEIDVDPWGLVRTDKEGFVLPTGRKIRYPELRQIVGDDGKPVWKYGTGRNERFLTGGKCDENIVQALARDVLIDAIMRVKKKIGLYPVHTVHDEVVYIVPESDAESVLEIVNCELQTPPSWWPDLVVWSEGDVADRYGEAK